MFVFTLPWVQGLKVFLFEVLMESWVACQDAGVLLESPSAMAGVHIAEALSTYYPLSESYCTE
jgi:sterol 3beta-glucosyltransferase